MARPGTPKNTNAKPALLAFERSISGTVSDALDGSPIQGANISAINGAATTVTDSNGSYQLIYPHTDSAFDIVFDKTGYNKWSNTIPLKGTDSLDVELTPNGPLSADFVGIHFIDASHGYAVGRNGLFLETFDAGANWKTRKLPINWRTLDRSQLACDDCGIRSAQISDAGGFDSLLVKTKDNIRIFNQLKVISTTDDSGKFTSLILVEQGGWRTGKDGLSTTSDGGESWQPASLPAKDLSAVQFRGSSNGWSVGADGAIWKTTDGGGQWTPQTSAHCKLNAVYFLSNGKRGWVAGENGTILSTIDGGENWIHLTQGSSGAEDAKESNQSQPRDCSHWPPPISGLGIILSLGLAVQAARAARAKPPEPAKGVADILVSDKPLEKGDRDALDLNSIALGLSRFLRNKRTVPPLTLAITGEWGTGKSSLMNLLKTDLRSYGFRPVWFNAWHHQKEEYLLASLLQCVRLQAVPRWWRPGGIAFRLQLLYLRGRRHWVPLLLLLLVFSAFWGYELHDTSAPSIEGILKSVREFDPKSLYDSLATHGGFIGFLATLVGVARSLWKGVTAFGKNPASLLASSSDGTSLRDLEAQTSFRQKFAQEFGDVTTALGVRKMLILIDDLDRCRPEQVLEVLEAINFLVSSGECFVVIGMARGRVEGCVGLSFKDVAAELLDDKEAPAKNETFDTAKARRREFARQYLDKLINIEVPVPTPSPDQSLDLLTAKTKALAKRPTWIKTLSRTAQLASGPLTVILVCAITIGAGYFLGRRSAPTGTQQSDPAPPKDQAPPKDEPQTKAGTQANANASASTDKNGSLADQSKIVADGRTAQPRRSTEGSKVDETNANVPVKPPLVSKSTPGRIVSALRSAKRPSGYGFIPIALVFSILVAIYVFNRPPDLVVEDSPEFVRALEIWHPLVVARDNTPRGMKRFVNRVRYLAMREQAQGLPVTHVERIAKRFGLSPRGTEEPISGATKDRIPESVIVALSAISAYNPSLLNAMVLVLRTSAGSLGDTNLSLFNNAKREHEEAFHNLTQLEGYRERFVLLASGIRVN